MKSAQLRRKFLQFFADKGHQLVSSSSLVPNNDPTLLFTNAGMVQFKDTFLGLEARDYDKATSSQRCVRAGGKHNDLENVGYTARHHTFFEMLGNFSFGDYFKREAIQFAWGFLTKELKLPEEKLWVTVFEDDQEAEDIWLKEMGVSAERFSRCGEKDNFWSMGDIGPCGPCTEIFYDHGEQIAGGPPGSPDEDGDRYVEIWNLVFMQYERNAKGELKPLAKPSVDTGMGLERVCAVMQGVHNNYDTDLFTGMIKVASELTGEKDFTNGSLRVIADHIRACSFLIIDGIVPSNEGRGYVLRRIARRAMRHGHKLGSKDVFFYKLVAPLIEVMGEAYPTLKEKQAHIEKVLQKEEQQFNRTLAQGMDILNEAVKGIKDKTIPGELVFQLYDTYGFPADLTADVARERGLVIDDVGFEKEMAKQRSRSQQASQFSMDENVLLEIDGETEFVGYEGLYGKAQVLSLFQAGKEVDKLDSQEPAIVILDKTPFYAEGGGQVGDKGVIKFTDGEFEVYNTTKVGAAFAHHGKLSSGSIKKADSVDAQVDAHGRLATARNHSATHLVHEALRQVLGEHVTQKGSLVESKRLRFDFSHGEAMTETELMQVESIVNHEIRENHESVTEEMSIDEAKSSGAMALFGEKYADSVRVLAMGEFSKEICGGTHVARTGDVGLFKIIREEGVAAGVRRIEAVTGDIALEWVDARLSQLNQASSLLKVKPEQLLEKSQQLLFKQRELEKEIDKLKSKLVSGSLDELIAKAKEVNGVKVLSTRVDGLGAKDLRELLDKLKDKLGKALIVLATVNDEKIQLISGVVGCEKLHAGKIMQHITAQVDGKGGGRPDMAQGAGTNTKSLQQALDSVYDSVN